jgi:putative endonuclease
MSTRRGEDGAAAELLAREHLTLQGLSVVARNYRCRGGEIDLVCDDRGTLVFVEVRYRASQRFGGAAATVDRAKQQRLVLAARHYLARHAGDGLMRPCRFDVVVLDRLDARHLEWIRDAFGE